MHAYMKELAWKILPHIQDVEDHEGAYFRGVNREGERVIHIRQDDGSFRTSLVQIVESDADQNLHELERAVDHVLEMVMQTKEALLHVLSAMQERSTEFSPPQLADMGFLCRELENAFDEVRKDAKARKELVAKVLGVRVAQSSIEDPENPIETPVRGLLCTASPKVQNRARIPGRRSDDYQPFMDHLGVPRETTELKILEPHYVAVNEWLDRLTQEGLPLPPGCTLSSTAYGCDFRRRRRK